MASTGLKAIWRIERQFGRRRPTTYAATACRPPIGDPWARLSVSADAALAHQPVRNHYPEGFLLINPKDGPLGIAINHNPVELKAVEPPDQSNNCDALDPGLSKLLTGNARKLIACHRPGLLPANHSLPPKAIWDHSPQKLGRQSIHDERLMMTFTVPWDGSEPTADGTASSCWP
jgi:hypothetical protein